MEKESDIITINATFCILATAFTVLIVPRIMKKIPLKLMIFIEVTLTSLSTFLMGLSHHIILFFILDIIRGIGAAMYGFVPITIVINNWIYKNNGLATSIALCFSGVAGALLSPIFSFLIESVGWEYTYFIVGMISFDLVLPFLLLPFKDKLEDENNLPYMMDESLINKIQFKEEKTHFNAFQLKFILLFIVGILLNEFTGMGSHFPTYALSIGFHAALGSLILSATMIGNIGFKFVIGLLSDILGIVKAVCIMLIIHIISLLMFILMKNEIALLVASFLFGSIYSITAVGIAIMTRKFFGELNYSSAYANVQFGCNFGVAFAVSLIGLRVI